MPNQERVQGEISSRLTYELRFKKLANAIHSAADFNAITLGLREQILSVYDVEMATIYLVDASRQNLHSWIVLPGEVLKKISIPINTSSISGYVAASGRPVSIRDVYDGMELMGIDSDLQFDDSWDQKTGSRSRQVLAVPIRFKNTLLGVIQLINKTDGSDFSFEEEKRAFDLAETLGIAFHNQYKASRKLSSRHDLLLRRGLLSEKDLEKAQVQARQRKRELDTVLVDEFKVPRVELGKAAAQFFGVPYVDLAASSYDPAELVKGINLDYFKKAHCMPLALRDGKLLLAVDDPHQQGRIDEIVQVLKASSCELRLALRADIERFVDELRAGRNGRGRKGRERSVSEILDEMKEQLPSGVEKDDVVEVADVEEQAVVALVRKIIEDACSQNASDIHIEPYGHSRDAEVRFRVDGQCHMELTIPRTHIRAVVSRFKILAQMDIADRRRPQDGKIKFRLSSGKEIELRVSSMPTADGNEDVVLRILADREPLPLKKLMPAHVLEPFAEIVRKPYGIILVVGPTGSGKTTTLHSALNYINTPEKKIWTAEDPVEITQYRLRQVQVNPKIDLTFAAAMRAFLRSDPDVIMVGEMRDAETVKMGIEASLTGHLVFSTLHTNSAPETVTRLIEMGMDPFNFADALLGILAQRLVRTLCGKCRGAYLPDREEYDLLRKRFGPLFDQRIGIPWADTLRLYRAGACETCSRTGYRGRSGLFELLQGSAEVKERIIRRASVDEIREQAIGDGMRTLLQEGIRTIFEGLTDYQQVMGVCG